MAICSHCGAPLSDTAKFCSECGTPVAQPAGPARSGAGTQPKRRWLKWTLILLGAAFLVIVACCAMALLAPTPEGGTPTAIARSATATVGLSSTPSAPATPALTNTPMPTNTPIPLAPPVSEIIENHRQMTDVQWDAYVKQLRETLAQDWEGWVEDVDKILGKYVLYVDVDPPELSFSTYEVAFNIPEEMALAYNQDQYIRFTGIVERVSIPLLGSINIRLKDVTVEIQD